jgi:hypothetical protein
MNKFLLVFFAAVWLASAQTPTASQVAISEEPPRDFFTKLYYKTGNDTYYCVSKSQTALPTTIAHSSITTGAASIVTVAGGHGLHINTSPQVTIKGATLTWAGLNGTFKVTVLDSTSFSVPFNSSALGAVTGTVVMTTTAPRTSSPIWAVTKITTDAVGNPLSDLWANGGWANVCDNRTILSYQ